MIRPVRGATIWALACGLMAVSAHPGLSQAPTLTVSPALLTAGQTLTFTVTGRSGQNPVIAFSRFGAGGGRFRGQTLLLGGDLRGLAGGLIGPGGTYTFSVPIPAGLSGLFFFQAAVADDAALTTNVVLTNGAEISLGGAHPVNNQVMGRPIPVGLRPLFAVAIPSQFPNLIHVINGGSNSLSVIDNTTDQVVTTIPLPGAVGNTATVTQKIFVAIAGTSLAPDNRVVVVDPATNTIIATLTVGSRPVGMDNSGDITQVFTANSGDGTLSIIDIAGLTASTIPIGGTPIGVNGFDVSNRAYVLSSDRNVFVLDTTTNQVITRIPVGNNPSGPPGIAAINRIYVSNFNDGTVSVIDTTTNSVTATIPVGGNPRFPGVSTVLKKIYVPDGAANSTKLFVVDATTNTLVKTITIGKGTHNTRLSPDGFRLYVTNGTDNTVSVIDTTTDTVVATIPVGAVPNSIRFTRDGLKAYIINQSDGTVTVIN